MLPVPSDHRPDLVYFVLVFFPSSPTLCPSLISADGLNQELTGEELCLWRPSLGEVEAEPQRCLR